MPKTKAQPTAFEISPSESGATVEVFEGKIAKVGGAIAHRVEIPRYDCVTVAEELALIEVYANLDASALQVNLDLQMALILLQRCEGYEGLQPEDVENWSLPMVKAMAAFLLAERREHKPQFSEEPQEDGDSPKAGGSTAPD